MELVHADAIMTISQKTMQNLDGAKITWIATEDAVLKYKDTLSDEDDKLYFFDIKNLK